MRVVGQTIPGSGSGSGSGLGPESVMQNLIALIHGSAPSPAFCHKVALAPALVLVLVLGGYMCA